jgi:hypothetical protein
VSARPRQRRRRPPPERRTPLDVVRGVPRIVRAIVATVGFIATVVGLLFVFWPSLKPDEPPRAKGATLSHPTVAPDLTFGGYLDRIGQSRRPYSATDLAARGAYVEFDFAITGYKHKNLPLRWQLVDAATGAQLDQRQDLFIKPDVNEDRASWEVWVPAGRSRRRAVFVELALYNPPGTVPIGRLRTAPFTMRAA